MHNSIGRLLFAAIAFSALWCRTVSAVPVVHITEAEENNDSIRVYYQPVPGAADYRVYTLDNPKEVKYAGIVHLFAPNNTHWVTNAHHAPLFPYRTAPNAPGSNQPSRIDVPNLNIECNGLDPGVSVKLIVEAVDHVGPSPFSNLATEGNMPVSPKHGAPTKMPAMPMGSKSDSADVMALLGSNAGPTDDGLYSINGQSGPHIRPGVLARSRPFLATPTGKRSLPSVRGAQQVVFDTFSQGHIEEIPGTRNTRAGNVSYLMHTDAPWRIDFLNDDIFHSRPFIMNRHYMDVLFDGSTPGTGLPLHIAHGAMTMTPVQMPNFSGGRVLHVTMECDGHMDGRRWLAFNIVPYDDPITNLYIEGAPINRTQTGLFVQFFIDGIASNLFNGKQQYSLAGSLGQAMESAPRPVTNGYDGHGLDDRSRFDLFLSKTRYAVFEDGQLVIDQKFPHGLPARLEHAKVYFTHYVYHTSNEIAELRSDRPWEHFWIDLFPYSDERHWDNMGYEVLPPSFADAGDDKLEDLIRDSRSVRVVQSGG